MTRISLRLAFFLLLGAGCTATDAPPHTASRAQPSAPAPAPAVDSQLPVPAAAADSPVADDEAADTSAPTPPDESVVEKVSSYAGAVAITSDSTPGRGPFGRTWRVWADGRQVLADSTVMAVRVYAVTHAFYPRVVAVLEMVPGGSACGARYRVLDVPDQGPPTLTREFGNCNDLPAFTWVRGGFQMSFATSARPGQATPAAERYEYRDSTLVRLASAGRPREVIRRDRVGGDPWQPAWAESRSRVAGRLSTPDGVLEIANEPTDDDRPANTHSVLVDGDTVVNEQFSMTMRVYAVVPRTGAHGTLVVIDYADGGTACEALYRVIELRRGRRPHVTDEFGNCGGGPEVITRNGVLRLEFAPYWHLWNEKEPGFRRPPGYAYEYRGGTMVRVRLASARERTAGQ